MAGPKGLAARLALSRAGVDDCWNWAGAPSAASTRRVGYCYVTIHGKSQPAHRAVYAHLVGPIPDGLELDHLCRNTLCVNPAHLEPVTHRVNDLRGVSFAAINAAKLECKNGHDITDPNNYWLKKYHKNCIQRICKECKRAANRRYLSRRRAA